VTATRQAVFTLAAGDEEREDNGVALLKIGYPFSDLLDIP
jgi:hypothetical protein